MSDPDSSAWKQGEAYQQAKNRVNAKLSFVLHLSIYIVANFIYVSYCWGNTTFSPIWILVPLGWGFGVVNHYLSAFTSYKESGSRIWVKPRFYLSLLVLLIVNTGYAWYCFAAILDPIRIGRIYAVTISVLWLLLPVLWTLGLGLHYLTVFVFLRNEYKADRRNLMDIMIERELQQQYRQGAKPDNRWPPAN